MRKPLRSVYLPISLTVLGLGGLYAVSLYYYATFLSLASLFSIALALGIFILVWTSRHYLNNNYLLFIGIAYLFIGSLQMTHTLALGIVGSDDYGQNTADYLWLASRYVESLTFLAAPIFINRALRPRPIFVTYTTITLALLATILSWNFSVAANVGATELALFTDASQYIITLIFIGAILLLFQKRHHFNPGTLRQLTAAMTITASIGTVSAVLQVSDQYIQTAGHLAQLIALGLIFQAVVDTGLTRPYQFLLSDLRQSKETIRQERDLAQNYLDVAGVIMLAIDTDGKVTLINKMGCEVLGYPEEEIIGKNWFDNFLPQGLREEVQSVSHELLSEEGAAAEYHENPVITKSGEERLIAWRNTVLRDEAGNITGHLSSGEDITERKRAEEALRESEEKLRRMFSSVMEGIVVTNLDGIITAVNGRAANMYGCSNTDELIGANSFKLVSPEDLSKVTTDMQNVLETGVDAGTEYYVTRKDGSKFPSETSTSVLRDASGNTIGFISVIRDITEQKQAEEIFRLISLNSPAGMYIAQNGKFVFANPQFLKDMGFTEDELLGSESLTLVHPDDREMVRQNAEKMLKGTRTVPYEFRTVSKTRETRWLMETVAPIHYRGEPAVLGNIVDITERKQAEEALQESEARYRALFETKPDGVIVIDETTKILLANQAVADMFGFDSIEEVYQVNLLDYIVPEYHEWAVEHITIGLFQDDRRGLYEIQCLKKNGDEMWVSVTGVRTEYGGKPAGIISVRDITDRKRMAEAIAKSAQRYRSLFENMPTGFVYGKIITDENDQPVDALFLEVNNSVEELSGFKKEQLIGRRFTEIIPALTESNPDLFSVAGKVALTGEDARYEEYFEPLGKWISSSLYSPEKGYFTATFEDITERKQAEEIFRTISLRSPAGMYIVQDGKFVFANPRFFQDGGITESELIGSSPRQRVHPDDQEMVRQNAVEMLKGLRTAPYEFRVVDETGNISWFMETVTSIQYQGRRAVLGNVVDITEQKRTEEKFKESEEKLGRMFESVADGITITDLEGKIVQTNAATVRMHGFSSVDAVIGRSAFELITENDRARASDSLKKTFEEGHSGTIEYSMMRKDGSTFTGEVNATLMKDPAGNTVGFVAITKDITERKQMEEALKQSEHMYSTLVQEGNDGIVIVQDEILKFANPKILEITGYSLDEILEKPFANYVAPDDRGMVEDRYTRRIEQQEEVPGRYEAVVIHRDGKPVPVEISASTIEFEGSPAIMAILRDITERKEAERRIRAGRNRFRDLVELLPLGVWEMDSNFNTTFVNKYILEAVRYSAEEPPDAEAGTFGAFIPEDRERIKENCQRVLNGEQLGPNEYTVLRLDGTTFLAMIYSAPIVREGKTAGLRSVVIDITEQKQAEEIFQTISMTSTARMYIVQDGKFVFANPQFLEDVGFTEEELLGTESLALVHPEDRETVRRCAAEMLKGLRTTPYEYRASTKTGEVLWAAETVASIQYRGKRAVLGSALNITESKQTEEIFQTISLNSPASIYIMQDGKFVFTNPRIRNRLGIDEDEIFDTEPLFLIHPEDQQIARQSAIEMLKGLRTAPYEYRAILRTGETIWVAETVASIQYNGKPAVLGNVLDITERKQAEEIFQTLSLKSPIGMYIVQDGKFVFTNPQFLEDVGFTEEELLGTEAIARVHRGDRRIVRKNAIEMLKGTRIAPYEFRITSKTSETKWFMETVAPIQYQGKRASLGNILDITERKRAEEELTQSKERYQDLFDNTSDLIQSITADGQFIYVNDAWQKVLGYSKDEIANLKVWNIIHPDSLPHCEEVFQRVMSGETAKGVEAVFVAKDGRAVVVEGNIQSYFDNGKPLGTQGIFRDITERKQNEEIFRTLSLRSPIGMYIVQDGKFVFANPQFLSDLGWTEDELLGAESLSRVPSEDREIVRQNAVEMLKGTRTAPYEFRITSKTGETKWFMETVAPIQYQGKRAAMGNILDITERKQNEERLRDSRRRFRDLVNLLPLGVYEIDENLNFTFANEYLMKTVGFSAEERDAVSPGVFDHVTPEDRERMKRNIRRIMNGELLGGIEYTNIREDGTTYPIVTYSAAIMKDGKPAGLRGVVVDITERKKAEQEVAEKNRALEEANARLKEVDRLKSVFLSSMSHELRTPLNSIIGFTSLILDGMTGEINDEQREQLTLVKNSSNHLLSLINDVLDISKIEAGSVELSLEEFQLNDVVKEVTELLTPTAQTKNLKLITETIEDIKLFTDRRRVKQVLINLGSNAIKFTERGSIRFITNIHQGNGHSQSESVEIHVIDTGIGIKKEDVDKLFVPFQQVDGSLTRRYEGTGLGLHLSKKIVTMLGGDIWIKSKYGKGSDIAFTLPLKYGGDENHEENTGS